MEAQPEPRWAIRQGRAPLMTGMTLSRLMNADAAGPGMGDPGAGRGAVPACFPLAAFLAAVGIFLAEYLASH
jgi:hypothetical protein